MAVKAKTTEKKENYNLVIVESPAKAKTIEKFLGKGYKVTASNGHLIDLPKSKLGVDIENNFEPNYIVIRGKTSLLNELKKKAADAKTVYLATDPDREGEAISWHIANSLKNSKESIKRIEFNEITKTAVTAAIKNPREIDIDRVDAQQARRVLDRLVGYKLSPLLWQKVKRGLSAGRVQSATVKIVVDREREIRNFNPQEYWTIPAVFTDKNGKNEFKASYYGNPKKFVPKTEDEVKTILDSVKDKDFVITECKKSIKNRRPYPPFTTSTLQQDANRKLGFSTKKTMSVAQSLYEGVAISASSTVGLITYMRTDSTRISDEARAAAKEYIVDKFGTEFYPEKPNVYSAKKNAQDAHEAVRPTYINYTPEKVKNALNSDQYKLYNLIYTRFMASQMVNAVYDTMSYDIECNSNVWKATFQKLRFPGFLSIYADDKDTKEEADNNKMPPMVEGDVCLPKEFSPKQNFTSPPSRFTEASLVRTLEELGIGRPSTYAPTISTVLERKYIQKEKKMLVPTDLGEVVTELMEKNFPDIVSSEFTADMESKLDTIETDGAKWKDIIKDFYTPFEAELNKASELLEHVEMPVRTVEGEYCPNCGAQLVIKTGRFGEFMACPNYPNCKFIKGIEKKIEIPCPKCGGEIVERRSKKGATFYGCKNYPECDFSSWDLPLNEKCPVCGSYMALHRFRGRSYKKCSNENCSSNNKTSKE